VTRERLDVQRTPRSDPSMRLAMLVAALASGCGGSPPPEAPPAPRPPAPAACEPSPTLACFHDADVVSAFALVSDQVHGQAIVVAVTDSRIDGPVPMGSLGEALDALAARSSEGRKMAHAEVDHLHWLAPATRLQAPAAALPPQACKGRRVDITLRHGALENFVDFLASVNGLAASPPAGGRFAGEVMLEQKNVDLCPVLARAVELAGGKLAPKPDVQSPSKAWIDPPPCGDGHACSVLAELQVIGVVGERSAAKALVRRPEKAAHGPRVITIGVGDEIGEERAKVERIDGRGLHAGGRLVVGVAKKS